jgi:hypothetical protein
VKTQEQVSRLISNLTSDEDLQQDLWVCYLSGAPIHCLNSKLSEIKEKQSLNRELDEAIWKLITNPPNGEVGKLVQETFTDYERNLIFCLIIGLNTSQISRLKGISEVRIEQSLATIRYNSVWKKIYGTKEKLNR